MDSKLISGKEVSAQIKAQVKEEVISLNNQGIYPKLSVIIVGENPASLTYVKGKHKDCAECGIISENIAMPETVSQGELLAEIERLNNDDSVHGILVQLPLPKHIDEYADGNSERGKNMRKAICEKFGFVSLGFQTIEGVVNAIGLDKCKLCTYCWDGKE